MTAVLIPFFTFDPILFCSLCTGNHMILSEEAQESFSKNNETARVERKSAI